MAHNSVPIESHQDVLLETIRPLSVDERRLLFSILADEFGGRASENLSASPTLREARPEYLAVKQGRTPGVLPAPSNSVWISFQTPSRLAHDLQAMAQERQTSIDMILNELLSTSLAVLQMDHLPDEDSDSLAVRRELATASVAALGDFWDNEVDRAWQDFARLRLDEFDN